jgi:hypothetical protein
MSRAYLVEEILAVRYLDRDATGLPEHCFQSLYHLFVDGVDTGSAFADKETCDWALKFNRVEDVSAKDLEVVHTYFSGFMYSNGRRVWK